MGRKWASRDAENNLFDYGEAQRKRAVAAEALLDSTRAALKIAQNAQQTLYLQVSSLKIEKNRLRVALADIEETIPETWAGGVCRLALKGDANGATIADSAHHEKEGA
jgi:hypothetical protein